MSTGGSRNSEVDARFDGVLRWWPFAVGVIMIGVYAIIYLVLGSTGWGSEYRSRTQFCERAFEALVSEPANTWSNLAYIAVGLVVLFRISKSNERADNPLRGQSWGGVIYGVSAILIGMGSFAMHGTNTHFSGKFDVTMMMLFFSFPMTYTFCRMQGWSDRRFGVSALVINGALMYGSYQFDWGYTVWVAMIGIWLALEVRMRVDGKPWLAFIVPVAVDAAFSPIDPEWVIRSFIYLGLALQLNEMEFRDVGRRAFPWLWIGLLAFVLSHVFWLMGLRYGIMCDPYSWVQGHALWHMFSAAAMLFFLLYFETETGEPATVGAGSEE